MNSDLWKSVLLEQFEALRKRFLGLSARERLLVLAAPLIGILLLLFYMSGPVATAFRRQSAAISKARMDISTLPAVAKRYLEIKARRAAIESRFRQVEFREGTALSHLEQLIRDKAQIPAKEFNIRQGEARDFGRDYQQTPFTVKFSTSNLAALVEFLKELSEGAKPMILSRLDVTRRRGVNRLDVEMDASAIKHK